MPTSSPVMTVKQDGGAGSSTSMLGEDQPEPVQFADLISSFQAKEQSAGCGLPKNLTSSFPVAVQSGGPTPSAPFASLTSSLLATEESGGPDPIMDPTPFLGTELDSKPYQISPCVIQPHHWYNLSKVFPLQAGSYQKTAFQFIWNNSAQVSWCGYGGE